MKTHDVRSLRESVTTGVWSSSKGANKVLQDAWEGRKAGEKIIFIFSVTNR